jgi:hypothetical protein
MSESMALIPMSLQDTMTLGQVLAESKRFQDDTSPEQAVVKVLAGRELGFGPIASMTGIYVIKGKVSISANMMAQAVKRSAKYDYQIAEMTPERCEIAFYEGSRELGRSIFDAADAQKAGTGNMDKYPRNMLFARAMSNGVKWYCPDVFQAGVYTPEELGVSVDGDGEIINVTPKPTNGNGDKPHWIDRVAKSGKPIRAAFWAWAKDTLALSDEQVYQALGVEHVHDYAGTMDEAKAKIEAWVGEQLKQQVPA